MGRYRVTLAGQTRQLGHVIKHFGLSITVTYRILAVPFHSFGLSFPSI